MALAKCEDGPGVRTRREESIDVFRHKSVSTAPNVARMTRSVAGRAPGRRAAFTIFELMMALAIVAIVTGFAATSWQRTQQNNKTKFMARQIAGAFEMAHTSAIQNESIYGVYVSLGAGRNQDMCGNALPVNRPIRRPRRSPSPLQLRSLSIRLPRQPPSASNSVSELRGWRSAMSSRSACIRPVSSRGVRA